jgi:transcriptional regulator with XRE-family HTH domain
MQEKAVYVPTTFAVAIRAARFLRGYTLGDLAERTGVPTARISSFERGSAKPMPEEFGKLWAALSTDPPTGNEERAK